MNKLFLILSSLLFISYNIKNIEEIIIKSNKKYFLIAVILIIAAAVILFNMKNKPTFDSNKSFQNLLDQVAFGPRNPGSTGHSRAKDYLIKTLKRYADRVIEQNFVYHDKRDSLIKYNGTNIIASFNLEPEDPGRIMLTAHWDTRPFADEEKDSSKWSTPIPGANDGASGVAVLLEIARILKENSTNTGIDIILFDLEDIGDNEKTYSSGNGNPYCIGSEYFVNNLGNYRPKYGILLDMVGDKNLSIVKEANSYYSAPDIIKLIWDAADKINSPVFIDKTGEGIMDDHVHFLKRGIKVVDLIQQPFPDYWHTLEDTPDKCSHESLKQVGEVLVELLYSE